MFRKGRVYYENEKGEKVYPFCRYISKQDFDHIEENYSFFTINEDNVFCKGDLELIEHKLKNNIENYNLLTYPFYIIDRRVNILFTLKITVNGVNPCESTIKSERVVELIEVYTKTTPLSIYEALEKSLDESLIYYWMEELIDDEILK